MNRIQFCYLKLEEWGENLNTEFKQKIMDCRCRLRRLRARRDMHGIELYNAVRWEYLNLLEKQEIY